MIVPAAIMRRSPSERTDVKRHAIVHVGTARYAPVRNVTPTVTILPLDHPGLPGVFEDVSGLEDGGDFAERP